MKLPFMGTALVVFAAVAAPARAQQPAFEVASVKASGPGGPGTCFSRADVTAKPEKAVPATPAGGEIMKQMIQSLLRERFHLVIHKETQEAPVYALVIGKNGPKMKASAPEARGPMTQMGVGRLTVVQGEMADLARSLIGPLGRSVIDDTGIKGSYDLKLEWTPDSGPPAGPPEGAERREVSISADGPLIFTAIQEQLGLKLEPRRGPVEFYIIDRAEKPGEN
ncbi:MAG TPA: TIGR03435 family protein [Bryobacteraceae bacterium]|nr:TIGR03435 family protein [Bryobacteraceae bacterium]